MQYIQSWFHNFSKGERLAIVILITTIAYFLIVFRGMSFSGHEQLTNEFSLLQKSIQNYQLMATKNGSYSKRKSTFDTQKNVTMAYKKDKNLPPQKDMIKKTSFSNKNNNNNNNSISAAPTPLLFEFDPNTIEKNEMKQLGLSKYAMNNILKWRAKGGQFKKAIDFKKIYGISELQYKELLPFIKVEKEKKYEDFTKVDEITKNDIKESSILQNSSSDKVVESSEKQQLKNRGKIDYANSNNLQIDVNQCDAFVLQELYGIGPVLSSRILKYRNALGGFSSIDQLKEVYGIVDSTFLAIKEHLIINPEIKQIEINLTDMNSLKKHPYVNWQQAKIICRYRDHHGNYKNIDGFRKIGVFDSTYIAKIEPYLTFD